MHTKVDSGVGERGGAAVLVALSLVVLVGMAAIAVDGSVAYNERRSTQNASDNAALAAAWAACHGADPEAAGRAVALANGYDDDETTITVEVNDLGNDTYHVVISRVMGNQFGGAIGTAETTVVSEATAECDLIPWVGGFAIFAGAPPSCSTGVELNFTGAQKTVNGGIHSNGDIQIQGATTIVNGPVSYVGSANIGGGVFNGGPPSQSEPWSYAELGLDFTIADVLAANAGNVINAGSATINNSYIRTNGYGTGTGGFVTITTPGVYYTTGSVDLNNASVGGLAAAQGVTFVSQGPIHVRGSGNMHNFDDTYQVLMMSTYPGNPVCGGSDIAIQWSASNGVWEGLIYAPNGQARQNNANSFAVNGSVVAYTVSLNGASFDISWQDNPAAEPKKRIDLKE